MRRSLDISGTFAQAHGFTLVELLVVIAVVGVCIALAVGAARGGFATFSARGAAQCWQAAAAWVQTDLAWNGGSKSITVGSTDLRIVDDSGFTRGSLDQAVPECAVSANPGSWQLGQGVKVRFTGEFAAPSGGGSIYFHTSNGAYRVAVRPVSGLSIRTYQEDER